MAVGPGLGRSRATQEAVRGLLAAYHGRAVVDADGLFALGTGEVLAGLTGALLAQGLEPFDAARLGAWVHGRAGSLATGDLSPVSVAAGDVADHLSAAFRELLADRPGSRGARR